MGTLSSRRRHSGLYSRGTTINLLRFFWIAILVWCEVGTFFWSLSDCRWPDRAFKKTDTHASPSHVMILADPHFRHSGTIDPSASWLTSLGEFFVHLNLRKSWNAVSRLNPHIVIVLGDMLDQGRSIMTDEQYEQYYERFHQTFKHHPYIRFYYVTGNHDVGLGSHREFSGQARRRFRQNFGPEQQVFEFGNHTFVAIDAPALVDEDYRRHAAEIDFESWQGAKAGPISFVKAVKSNPPTENRPTILLTHIPLARPGTAHCGPKREQQKGLHRGAGFGFQNLLGKETTHFVLQSLKPALVFSGDDHDYCDYIHRSSDGDIREVTVRSFAMAEGIKRPGFQLLSLYTPPSGSPRRADLPCLLPDQIHTYTIIYFPFFVLTILYIAYTNATLASPASSRPSRPLNLQPLRTPTINDVPPTPSHLSVRRTASSQNFATLTPRLTSRPSSPMLGAQKTPILFAYDDEDAIIPSSPGPFFPATPLLPSPFPYNAEPDSVSDNDEPLGMNGGPTRHNGAFKRWLKNDRTRDGWRRWLSKVLSSLHLWWNGRPTRAGAVAKGRSNEGVAMRVGKDLLQTAWPPLLVASFIWWRLFSW